MIEPDEQLRAGRTLGPTGQSSGETTFEPAPFNYTYKTDAQGNVTEFEITPRSPRLTIRTRYVAAAKPEGSSAYGRGTTDRDRAAGTTSLRFHEGSHGTDFVRYLREHPFPEMPNPIGMNVRELRQAVAAYREQVRQYLAEMEAFSQRRTDCVGEKASFCPP